MAYSDFHVINTYNIFLSSANRTSGTSDNFTVALQKPIILSSPNNFFTVRVGSAEIPYVFPLINNTNNVIDFIFIRDSISYSGSITITPGTYNINTLNDEFRSKLISAIFNLTGVTIPLSFTYDKNAGKATYSMPGTDSITTLIFVATNTSYATVFLRCIGFSNVFQFGYTTPTSRTDATSTQNVNVSQNNSIYIRSESLTQTQNFENIVNPTATISDILAKVQIATPYQSYLLWTNQIDLEIEVSNRVIDMINLYLGTSTAYSLSLGNLDWACRITIKEHSDVSFERQNEDRATNMPTMDMTPLLNERQKLVEQLKSLKYKLIPKKKDGKKETTEIPESNQEQIGESNPNS
jgi:hypothetical protein